MGLWVLWGFIKRLSYVINSKIIKVVIDNNINFYKWVVRVGLDFCLVIVLLFLNFFRVLNKKDCYV